MKQRWNLLAWAGFLVVVVAFLSYFVIFTRFPVTRDIPWVNLLLFLTGGWLLAVGLKRAFKLPDQYRGKVSGSILAVLSVLALGVFVAFILHFAKQLPSSRQAPQVGEKAADFTLPDKEGNLVTLSQLLASPVQGTGSGEKTHGALLIFYRGYW